MRITLDCHNLASAIFAEPPDAVNCSVTQLLPLSHHLTMTARLTDLILDLHIQILILLLPSDIISLRKVYLDAIFDC